MNHVHHWIKRPCTQGVVLERYEIEEGGGSERKHILYVRQSYSKHKRLPQSVNYDGGGKDVRKRDLGEGILNTEKSVI